jgi:4-amino-4-deoxy-L-arabinose transferase-like glycosyltransferase
MTLPPGIPRSSLAWPLLVPVLLLALGIHALPQPGFGFHRDELLYFAMGDHLDFLRMQFPPLIALVARIMKGIFGDSLAGARLLPALAHATLIVLAAAMARAMGGAGRSQLLAALGVLVAPVFVRAGTLFQPVVFEMLWWSLALLALLELLSAGPGKERNRGWWILLGLALGVGAMTKFSIAFLMLGATVTVLLSPLRNDLGTRWPWFAVLIAVVLALPSMLGQAAWQWPFLLQMQSLRQSQLERVSPFAFLAAQPMMLGPAAVLMLAGAWSIMVGPLSVRFRPLAYAAIVVLVVLLALHGKDYYFAPMHPLLIATGAVALLQWSEQLGWHWLVPATAAFLLLGGTLLLPLGAPILTRDELARYAARLGATRAVTTNRGTVLPLPQDFADMIGWEELATATARVYHELPEAEQRRAAVAGGNYGRAGALALYSARLGMTYPISRHGDFYNWGLPARPIDILIIAGGSVEEFQSLCETASEEARVSNPWGVDEEQDVPIILCRGLKRPLPELWKLLGPVWG